MIRWILDPANATFIAALGLILSLLGTAATLLGLYLTYKQARQAASSAETARQAVIEFRARSDGYDAASDLAQVSYALDATRAQVGQGAWREAVESYESARNAAVRIRTSAPNLDESDRAALLKMARQMAHFCKTVDAATAGKGDFPDETKIRATIRKHQDLITQLKRIVKMEI